jgi:hypothetical protein
MWNNFIQKEAALMQQRTTKVNASEKTIKIGPLGIRFLLTGDDSNGSVSVFAARPGCAEVGSTCSQE